MTVRTLAMKHRWLSLDHARISGRVPEAMEARHGHRIVQQERDGAAQRTGLARFEQQTGLARTDQVERTTRGRRPASRSRWAGGVTPSTLQSGSPDHGRLPIPAAMFQPAGSIAFTRRSVKHSRTEIQVGISNVCPSRAPTGTCQPARPVAHGVEPSGPRSSIDRSGTRERHDRLCMAAVDRCCSMGDRRRVARTCSPERELRTASTVPPAVRSAAEFDAARGVMRVVDDPAERLACDHQMSKSVPALACRPHLVVADLVCRGQMR
jgi:hypothetical protein